MVNHLAGDVVAVALVAAAHRPVAAEAGGVVVVVVLGIVDAARLVAGA